MCHRFPNPTTLYKFPLLQSVISYCLATFNAHANCFLRSSNYLNAKPAQQLQADACETVQSKKASFINQPLVERASPEAVQKERDKIQTHYRLHFASFHLTLS